MPIQWPFSKPSTVWPVPSRTTSAPSSAAPGDVGGDLVAVGRGDQRAHLGGGVVARADLDLLGALADLLHQFVADRADGDDRGDRHAALAGRAVGGGHGGVGGRVEVGVGQHQHVVLGAAEGLDALAVGGGGGVDIAGDGRGADEGHGLDVRVLQQAVDGHLVAVHDVEHALGQPGLGEQLGEADGGGRVLLAGLQHEGVAAGDGEGNIHIGTIAGKLNGVMPATTPSGWRMDATSTRLATWVDSSPLSWTVMPQARSTISRRARPRRGRRSAPCRARR